MSSQCQKAISIQPLCLTDSYYDYILEEIVCRDKIEFERDVNVYSHNMEDYYEHSKLIYMYLLYILF